MVRLDQRRVWLALFGNPSISSEPVTLKAVSLKWFVLVEQGKPVAKPGGGMQARGWMGPKTTT